MQENTCVDEAYDWCQIPQPLSSRPAPQSEAEIHVSWVHPQFHHNFAGSGGEASGDPAAAAGPRGSRIAGAAGSGTGAAGSGAGEGRGSVPGHSRRPGRAQFMPLPEVSLGVWARLYRFN